MTTPVRVIRMLRVLTVPLAYLALVGCGDVSEPVEVLREEPGAGEEDLDLAKADGDGSRWTFYRVTEVTAQGLRVRRFNQPDTKCADARWAESCVVVRIDWSRAGLSNEDAAAADVAVRERRALLRGKLVQAEIDGRSEGVFRVSETWETPHAEPVDPIGGQAWWVSGRCDDACTSLLATRLNKGGASTTTYATATIANLTSLEREAIASEGGALVVGTTSGTGAHKHLEGLRTYLRREHTEAESTRTDGPKCSATAATSFPKDELRIHIIDVGQGDAIWVQTPWKTNREESLDVLVDAGASGTMPGSSPGGDIVVQYLLAHGLAEGDVLDALVVTHAHDDHFGGVERVTESFGLARYVDPGFTAGSAAFIAARAAAREDVEAHDGTMHVPAVSGLVPQLFADSDLFGPRVQTTLLWSEDDIHDDHGEPTGPEVNNTSIALSLVFGGRRVLLMGDAESAVEAALVAAHDAGEIDLEASVLKVAHHGSARTTGSEFLARAFPTKRNDRWALISSGRRSFQGSFLPADTTLRRLVAALPDGHLLSTENRDQHKSVGDEHRDDTILVRIKASGQVSACYVPQ